MNFEMEQGKNKPELAKEKETEKTLNNVQFWNKSPTRLLLLLFVVSIFVGKYLICENIKTIEDKQIFDFQILVKSLSKKNYNEGLHERNLENQGDTQESVYPLTGIPTIAY